MTSIRIPERASVEDVLSWDVPACSTIRLTKRASFEPGAQGLALALLSILPSSEVVVECDFGEPSTPAEVVATLFSSAFGFSLARLARRLNFEGKSSSPAFKPLLSTTYKGVGGVLGIGTSRSAVCADPVFPMPPLLAAKNPSEGSQGADPFPAPSAFAAFLNNIVTEMGFRSLLRSSEEAGVVAFVYEALRNSWEHGRSSEPVRRARGTRALIVEKLVLQGGDLSGRRLSPELKDYALRINEAHGSELGLGVVCLTVADQGNGIANTLPAKEGETATERLIRAFAPGESRKPASVVQRGLGLPKLVSSAHQLQALLRVSSAGLTIGQDFSLYDSKYPTLELKGVREVPNAAGAGTAVSIYLPEFAFNLDQSPLFGR
jgi:hypothetical protein